MKIEPGDLYRVKFTNTHRPCQYGAFVVLSERLRDSLYWAATNLSTGNWHHYRITDLEFIAKGKNESR